MLSAAAIITSQDTAESSQRSLELELKSIRQYPPQASQGVLEDVIPGGGTPGVDYPTLSHVPITGFTCEAQSVGGYYADISSEAGCQVFHICQNERIDSYLCPNGTLFNQRYFVCDWWFNVRCEESQQFYELNTDIGKQEIINSEAKTISATFSNLQNQYQHPS